ncbi:hypothetical protein [Streptomyces sp. NPDC060366]|uniref:ApeA N-terminal domain 1-containing protein n=1 Tax=Streptomyces sp. NPDC060366 TaxID=3347105 RepID=UPI00364A63D1
MDKGDMMPIKTLTFGDSLAGLLVDGVEGTPYVVATLTYSETRGVRLEVPYIHHSDQEQFANAEKWFETGAPPKNLMFITHGGVIYLFGCRYSGHSMNFGHGHAAGFITPDEVVLANRDGDLTEDLKVSEFTSELDALFEWTRFRAVHHERETNEEGRVNKVTITAESMEGVSWTQGEAEMKLNTSWSTSDSSPGFQITEWVALQSTFPTPRPMKEHLSEQRKLASLLKLAFGQPIYFRRHKIRDDLFADTALNGRTLGKSFHEAISHRTFRDFSQPKPERKKFRQPVFYLAQVGGEGLERWGLNYEPWKRFIEPAVSVLSRPGTVLENLVVNASMSLEAAGSLLGHISGEEETHNGSGYPTTATYVLRAILSLDIDWQRLSESPTALARAISKNYNTIKHFDRGVFPDPIETYFVSEFAMTIVRLVATNLVDPTGQLVRDYATSSSFDELVEMCRRHDRFVGPNGAFINYPS